MRRPSLVHCQRDKMGINVTGARDDRKSKKGFHLGGGQWVRIWGTHRRRFRPPLLLFELFSPLGGSPHCILGLEHPIRVQANSSLSLSFPHCHLMSPPPIHNSLNIAISYGSPAEVISFCCVERSLWPALFQSTHPNSLAKRCPFKKSWLQS